MEVIKAEAVLFGGTSKEKLVSVATAVNMANFLPDAIYYFWDESDAVIEVDREELLQFKDLFLKPFLPINAKNRLALDDFLNIASENNLFIFNCLHGGRGENGWIQKKFEDKKIKFSGSDSHSSSICMDKAQAKKILRLEKSIKLPHEYLFDSDTLNADALTAFLKLHDKIVLKPVSEGSSRGLFVVNSEEELASAMYEISKLHVPMITEEFIEGRELTIGVLTGFKGLRALCPSEVILDHGATFDYNGKYLGQGSREITPAEITNDQKRLAQEIALKAHELFHCSGCSRTEVIFNEKGFYFLETNTLPGLTRSSFIPQQLAAENISMSDFLNALRC